MRAATYSETGPSSVLRVAQVERPEPGLGEVRVRLRVAGVNPSDWKARARGVVRGAFQIPGQDGAGEIDAVGEGVDPARTGERVWVWFAAHRRPWGTTAQWTVVPARQAVPLPAAVGFDVGATLGIPALTAHRCLTADGPVAGLPVLIAGGAGAVGHAAIGLARWLGADPVIATVSGPEKGELARAAGAHAVVDYRAPDADEQIRALAPGGVARVVEVALSRNLALDLAVCARGATIAAYADELPVTVTELPAQLIRRGLALRGVLIYATPRQALDDAVAGVTDALGEGRIASPLLHRFPLEQAGSAHDAVERGAVGKVLIDLP